MSVGLNSFPVCYYVCYFLTYPSLLVVDSVRVWRLKA